MARCTVERLMAELGLSGAVRGKVKRTTIADPAAAAARRSRAAPVRSAGTQPAVGGRPHLRVDVVGLAPTSRSSSTPTPAGSWAGGWRRR